MAIQINANKRIGRVIFFVEGPVDEPILLKRIFSDLLGYHAIILDKRDQSIQEYAKANDPYSKVYVVSMPSSALKNIPGGKDFLDAVYARLKEYGLHQDEARVFYLFDRDRQSNKADTVEAKISLLRNPLDNGSELPGALLLSYPCLQSYYCQAHDDPISFPNSQKAKSYVNVRGYKALDQDNLLSAASCMLKELSLIRHKEMDLDCLSDYGIINRDVYQYEEAYWNEHKHHYLALSLLSLALLDLGILSMRQDSIAISAS